MKTKTYTQTVIEITASKESKVAIGTSMLGLLLGTGIVGAIIVGAGVYSLQKLVK